MIPRIDTLSHTRWWHSESSTVHWWSNESVAIKYGNKIFVRQMNIPARWCKASYTCDNSTMVPWPFLIFHRHRTLAAKLIRSQPSRLLNLGWIWAPNQVGQCQMKYKSLIVELKRAFKRIRNSVVLECCNSWTNRLYRLSNKNGSYFEINVWWGFSVELKMTNLPKKTNFKALWWKMSGLHAKWKKVQITKALSANGKIAKWIMVKQ